jgi:protoheme IX farnesyltransferase
MSAVESPTPTAEMAAPRASRFKQFYSLTKPRVVQLIVFCALIGMVLAVPGLPSLAELRLMLVGCAGIWLVAGAAAAFNCIVEKGIDSRMKRTAWRPTAKNELGDGQTFLFSAVLGTAGSALLYFWVNPLTMWLTFATFVGYAVVYTVILKPLTPQNIVIGGASGAFPPMIGWAAVTGDVSLASISLFLIIFMWTPPHFWALSLYKEGDYAKAGVPMMPVVAGQRSTKLQMLVYTLILCPLTLVPVYLGVAGWVYGAASIALNLGFVGHAIRVLRSDDLRYAKRMFGFSLLYLFLHFALLCVDRAPGIISVLS